MQIYSLMNNIKNVIFFYYHYLSQPPKNFVNIHHLKNLYFALLCALYIAYNAHCIDSDFKLSSNTVTRELTWRKLALVVLVLAALPVIVGHTIATKNVVFN
jgi:hypothetical protein